LQSYPDVMVLADRGFANHDLLAWLSQSRWHYGLRLPSDVGDIVKSGVRQEIKRRPAVGLTRYCHRLDSHL
jgi:hypothetical protein